MEGAALEWYHLVLFVPVWLFGLWVLGKVFPGRYNRRYGKNGRKRR
jgi:hypothetical protein